MTGRGSRRWPVPPVVGDVVILAVLLVPQLLILVSSGRTPTDVAPAPPLLQGTVLVLAHLPVLLRRGRPRTALGLTLLVSVAVLAGGDPAPGLVLAVLAHSVGYRGEASPAGRLSGATVARAGLAGTALLTALAQWTVGGTVAPVAAVAVGAATGLLRREVTQRRARRRERADAAAVEAALAADRHRIGTELHEVVRARLADAVGHADRARSGTAPEIALEAIARDTRGALTALREMLTLLRAPDGPPASQEHGAGPSVSEPSGRRSTVFEESDSRLPGDRRRTGDRSTGTPARLRAGLRTAEWSDVALALSFAVAVPLLGVAARTQPPPVSGVLAAPSTVVGWMLLAACLVPVPWRRRYASAGVWVASAALALSSVTGGGGGYLVTSVAWSVLVVTAVSRDRWRRWVPALVFGAVVGLTGLPLAGFGRPTVSVVLAATASNLVLVGWGLALQWRRSARTAERLRQQRARAAVSRREQRLRIARDLHDVVAHHVSGMAVQAATAHALAAERPDLVADALAHVRETGRTTLAAMPALLDVLDTEHPGSPAPGGIDGLAGPLRAVGAPVEVLVAAGPEIPRHLAGEVHLLVQEALTNVLRHAGPAPTRVSVRRIDDTVEVSVDDDGPVGGHRAEPGGGFGLVGMRERVAVLGGEIETGPSGTGWRVHARLPCVPVPAGEPDDAPARALP